MKANTPELMKFKKLQRKLGETRRGIIGLLEAMWIEVARNCPEGDIGRFSDEEIAIMVDWEGDPKQLVDALTECRWLDVCEEHRLVVHDWADHCPTYVRGGLAKKRKSIATPKTATQVQAATVQLQAIAISSELQAEHIELEAIATSSEVSSTKPSLFKPSQAYSSQANSTQPHSATSQKKFTQPTLEEVRTYCDQTAITIDVELFVDHYSAQGWKLSNGRAMVDWRAAARKWAKNDRTRPQSQPTTFAQQRVRNTMAAIDAFVGEGGA